MISRFLYSHQVWGYPYPEESLTVRHSTRCSLTDMDLGRLGSTAHFVVTPPPVPLFTRVARLHPCEHRFLPTMPLEGFRSHLSMMTVNRRGDPSYFDVNSPPALPPQDESPLGGVTAKGRFTLIEHLFPSAVISDFPAVLTSESDPARMHYSLTPPVFPS